MPRRPTLESLARELGVSRQTISNAINRPEIVAPETLARVKAAIEAAQYTPSRAARQLRTRSSRTIGLRLMPNFDGINGHILDLFIHELAEQARRSDYRLLVFAAEDTADEISEYAHLAAAREIDGVILTSTTAQDPRFAWLSEHRVPFASFGRPWSTTTPPEEAEFPWVDVDGAAGTEAVVERLVAAGHTRIGYVSWPILPGVGQDRHDGWSRAIAAAGLRSTGLVCECEDDAIEARAAAGRLLDAGATAIVCASDTLALGARAEAIRRDSRIVVVGFDDTPVARALQLNSVTQPVVAAARQALAMLLERIQDPDARRHALLTPTFVVRDESLADGPTIPMR
nr:LacI family transcriptional regulator [Actinomycetales bacterium]